VLDAPREGVQVFLKRQEQHNLPLESNLPWVFKYSITNWSTLRLLKMANKGKTLVLKVT
jgi:hypothetical protein